MAPAKVDKTGSVRLFRGQDYAKLKAKCWSEAQLFTDPEFPADATSLGFNKDVEWKRPTEMAAYPQFMKDVNRFSVVQGELGDCWFVSALSAITQNPGLLRRVVPEGQDFTMKYVGIFHFRFWQGGEWVDVVVDDQLPVIYGSTLCFSSSRNNSEFWSALLEKAYAKLHGCYGALNSGKSYEATEDLTGGVTERYLLHREDLPPPPDLFSIVAKARQRGSLVTCNVSGSCERECENGLVMGHAYSITGARRCRIHVPWKPYVDLTEWKGPWSDGSDEWRLMSKREKEKLQLTDADDGEFWMSFEEFKRNFDEVFITSLNPHTINQEAKEQLYNMADVVTEAILHPEQLRAREVKASKVWEVVTYDGSWVRNSTAGGSPNNQKLFSNNPQYLLKLTEADDDTDEADTCAVIVSLTQKNRRVNQLPLYPIGFFVYQINEGSEVPTPATVSWFRFNAPLFYTKKFTQTRTVTHRLSLRPGQYLLIPCTLKHDQEADFLLRVFCEKVAIMEENDEHPMILDTPETDEVDSRLDSFPGSPKINILRGVFLASAGDDNEVDAVKLKLILDHLFPYVEFSLDLSRSLLAMMDGDLSGKVSYFEFEKLIQSLRRWVRVYNERKDEENDLLSGHSWGLGDALRDLGLQIPRRIRALVVVRYGDEQGHISLRDFLMATCRISVMLERFESHRNPDDQEANIRLHDWLRDTLYC
ncbi:calpain-B-like [Penaeus indicus]|uniref:calpain-B-like n=1 Tax=Penaeus indicus TaxID=29960 RepID=UPI00300CAB10